MFRHNAGASIPRGFVCNGDEHDHPVADLRARTLAEDDAFVYVVVMERP
ncbi:hypothetical protein [Halogranum amylolyticum]|nr:hypothetical protein [Halogranum amylolyticum]